LGETVFESANRELFWDVFSTVSQYDIAVVFNLEITICRGRLALLSS
jgi:hypothetical protein